MPGKRLPEEERREAIIEAAFRVATRERLGGLSARAVAEAAGVSKGLVFFHFNDRERLLLALLEWLLKEDPRVRVPPELEGAEWEDRPAKRLLALLEHQLSVLPTRRDRSGLFLDYWVLGTAVPDIQRRIRSAFKRYRSEFLPWTAPVVAAAPERFEGVGGEGLAGVVVSFIQGCSMQLIADPTRFDLDQYRAAVRGLVVREP